MKKTTLLLVLFALLIASCTPTQSSNEQVTEVSTPEASDNQFEVNLVSDDQNAVEDVEVNISDLGESVLVEVTDPRGRYLPSISLLGSSNSGQIDVEVNLKTSDSGFSTEFLGEISLDELINEDPTTIPLEQLENTLEEYGTDAGLVILIPRTIKSQAYQTVELHYPEGTNSTVLILPEGQMVGKGPGLAAPSKLGAPVLMIPFAMAAMPALVREIRALVQEHSDDFDLMAMLAPGDLDLETEPGVDTDTTSKGESETPGETNLVTSDPQEWLDGIESLLPSNAQVLDEVNIEFEDGGREYIREIGAGECNDSLNISIRLSRSSGIAFSPEGWLSNAKDTFSPATQVDVSDAAVYTTYDFGSLTCYVGSDANFHSLYEVEFAMIRLNTTTQILVSGTEAGYSPDDLLGLTLSIAELIDSNILASVEN